MCVCGVPNKKLLSLAYMPNEQKVQNVTMASISACVCVCVCVHVYLFFSVCVCVCVWYTKYKISIFGIYAKWTKKWKIHLQKSL